MNEQWNRPNPPVAPAPPWRLLRADEPAKMVSGVCAGLAAAAGVDVTLVRLAFVAAGLSGFGIVAYIVLALVVPRPEAARGEQPRLAPPDTGRWIRIALIVGALFGVLGLLDGGPPFFDGPGDGAGFVIGLVLCVAAAVIFWTRRGRSGQPPAPTTPWGGTVPATAGATMAAPAWAPPAPAAGPGWEPIEPSDRPAPTAELPTTEPTAVHPHMPAPPPPAGGPAAASPDRPRRSIGAAAVIARVAAWLVVIAALPTIVAIAAAVRIDALSVPWAGLFLALGVAAVLGLMVLGSTARSAAPVMVSIAAVFGLVGVLALVSHWNGEIGERFDAPTTRGDVPAVSELAIGHHVIDLSKLDVTGDPVTIDSHLAIGYLEVVVPDDATVQIEADVQGGVIALFGQERDGWNTDFDLTDGSSERARYVLDLEVGYGRLEVCRAADASLSGGVLQCSGGAS